MRKTLIAFLVLVLFLIPAQLVFGQELTSNSLSFTVTGTLYGLPGSPAAQPFSCSVSNASPSCTLPNGKIALDFEAVDGDSYRAQFNAAYACGATTGTCTALFVDDSVNDQVDSVTCSSGFYRASHADRGYFPASCGCFGGTQPSFGISWSAQASCTTTTTTSTTSTT